MKKKLFSIILSLALMVTMMPAQTLVVSAATKTKATVSTQTGLKKALKNKELKTLTVKTSKVKTFSVNKGTHKKVHMIIDASKSTVKNNAVFKKITIKKNKTLVMNTTKGDITVSKGGKVNEVKLTKSNSKINFNVTGELKKISVEKKSEISIKGSTKKTIAVNAGENSDDTVIKTSVKVNAKIGSNAEVKLSDGSEGSSIAVTNKDVKVTVVNNTDASYTAIDANGKTVEIKKEETVVIGGNTPSPTPIPTPTRYTVIFDLNGVSGTAPVMQTVIRGNKASEPVAPTLENHNFAGWYKTKDATTGILSDPWDFEADVVTSNMTLYAQWTRTMESILSTNQDIPSTTVPGILPENPWIKTDDSSSNAYIFNGPPKAFYLKNATSSVHFTSADLFIKNGDNYLYYFEYGGNTTTATCFMNSGKFTSFEYTATNTSQQTLNGTYIAPIAMPAKGDIIKLDGQETQYKVIKVNGVTAEVMDMTGGIESVYDTDGTTTTIGGETVVKYKDSDLDTFLNGATDGCYYKGLTNNIKNAIVSQDIDQYAYKYISTFAPDTYAYSYEFYWDNESLDYAVLLGYENVGYRNIYALDLKDVFEYYGKSGSNHLTSNETNKFFFNQTASIPGKKCWLRSAARYNDYAWAVYGEDGYFDQQDYDSRIDVHPAFTVDLYKCSWENATE